MTSRGSPTAFRSGRDGHLLGRVSPDKQDIVGAFVLARTGQRVMM